MDHSRYLFFISIFTATILFSNFLKPNQGSVIVDRSIEPKKYSDLISFNYSLCGGHIHDSTNRVKRQIGYTDEVKELMSYLTNLDSASAPAYVQIKVALSSGSKSQEMSGSCGGSLLHDNIVLTSATCLDRYNADGLSVQVRADFRKGYDGPRQVRYARNYCKHPSAKIYRNTNYTSHDLALVILDTPFNLNTGYVWPACFTKSNATAQLDNMLQPIAISLVSNKTGDLVMDNRIRAMGLRYEGKRRVEAPKATDFMRPIRGEACDYQTGDPIFGYMPTEDGRHYNSFVLGMNSWHSRSECIWRRPNRLGVTNLSRLRQQITWMIDQCLNQSSLAILAEKKVTSN